MCACVHPHSQLECNLVEFSSFKTWNFLKVIVSWFHQGFVLFFLRYQIVSVRKKKREKDFICQNSWAVSSQHLAVWVNVWAVFWTLSLHCSILFWMYTLGTLRHNLLPLNYYYQYNYYYKWYYYSDLPPSCLFPGNPDHPSPSCNNAQSLSASCQCLFSHRQRSWLAATKLIRTCKRQKEDNTWKLKSLDKQTNNKVHKTRIYRDLFFVSSGVLFVWFLF